MPNITMSQKIKTLLDVTKCTPKELADFVETNQSTISHWVTRNVTPSPRFLPRIAQFFGISLEELYTDHPEEYLDECKIRNKAVEREEQKDTSSSLNKIFSKEFQESLLKISKDTKLTQDTEELISLFLNLDAWHRHSVLAHTYEQEERQNTTKRKNLPL